MTLALLSGTLLGLSFPKFGHPAVAWVALMPLLVVLGRRGTSVSRAFVLGLLAGVAYFSITLYWIPRVMVTYGDMDQALAVGVTALLIAYLALFPAGFAAATARLRLGFGTSALLFAPAVWVTGELGRMHLLSGFPWELLGYSQTSVLPVAQLASVFGVHGVSALVVLVNACAVYAAQTVGRRRVFAAGGASLCLALVLAGGGWRLGQDDLAARGESIKVGLIQGNIRQEDKWDPSLAGSILSRYMTLTREAAGRGARLIVWPESATPFYFEEDAAGREAIRQLARDTGAYLLIGSDQLLREPSLRIFNAAFLVTPGGETGGIYRKMHLVPFGEYVPARALIFFASPLVEAVSDFSPGTAPVTLPVGSHLASTAICYEVIYPGLIGRFVDRGSELLSTITNDAWYGASSAPEQHFQQATMRAIEQGRFLVRAANTGISGIIDPYGRVQARSPLFEEATIVGDVRWLSGRTVYGRIGDVFAWACAVVTAAALTSVGRRRAAGT